MLCILSLTIINCVSFLYYPQRGYFIFACMLVLNVTYWWPDFVTTCQVQIFK